MESHTKYRDATFSAVIDIRSPCTLIHWHHTHSQSPYEEWSLRPFMTSSGIRQGSILAPGTTMSAAELSVYSVIQVGVVCRFVPQLQTVAEFVTFSNSSKFANFNNFLKFVKIVRCSNLRLLDKIFVVASTLATTVKLEQCMAVADDNGDTPCTEIRKELYKATVRTLQSVICINIT